MVARLAANAAGVPQTTRTSTGIDTSSAANSGKRSSLPSPYRNSMIQILPFDPAQFLQCLAKSLDRRKRRVGDEPDTLSGACLLCERKTRPRCRTANQCDEIAPPHTATTLEASGQASYPFSLAFWKGSAREVAMSALGQKQTYALQQAMSTLPPIATAKADMPQ